MNIINKLHIKNKTRQYGLSLVEVLVAMILIVVALVPALQALQAGVQAARIDVTFTQQTPTEIMEQVLARSYAALEVAVQSGGATGGSATTAIAPYDPAVALGSTLSSLPAPAGPGFSNSLYNVFLDCISATTGLNTGTCNGLIRITVVSLTTGQQFTSYKAL